MTSGWWACRETRLRFSGCAYGFQWPACAGWNWCGLCNSDTPGAPKGSACARWWWCRRWPLTSLRFGGAIPVGVPAKGACLGAQAAPRRQRGRRTARLDLAGWVEGRAPVTEFQGSGGGSEQEEMIVRSSRPPPASSSGLAARHRDQWEGRDIESGMEDRLRTPISPIRDAVPGVGLVEARPRQREGPLSIWSATSCGSRVTACRKLSGSSAWMSPPHSWRTWHREIWDVSTPIVEQGYCSAYNVRADLRANCSVASDGLCAEWRNLCGAIPERRGRRSRRRRAGTGCPGADATSAAAPGPGMRRASISVRIPSPCRQETAFGGDGRGGAGGIPACGQRAAPGAQSHYGEGLRGLGAGAGSELLPPNGIPITRQFSPLARSSA